ncbi:hypothetical protein TNIN_474251 [Trichonephila inaurata madagascariensis]|uniref:Uncharacterized protein n=1 Tax=Trichonephila inaurata madagascariensis TaxID=2747483 RepID=A0A8X6XE73_9ARAC|nr:hypothetical protein TNIN_474251 [Trichonephila inaurata madagascariensis]
MALPEKRRNVTSKSRNKRKNRVRPKLAEWMSKSTERDIPSNDRMAPGLSHPNQGAQKLSKKGLIHYRRQCQAGL